MDIQLKELVSLSYNFSYYCRFSWRFSGRSFEHAADEVVEVSGFHSESPFEVIPYALGKGIGGGTMVERCEAQVRGGWV